MYDILKGGSSDVLLFFLTDSTDHISAKTGVTATVTLSKNGGSFASPSGAVTEVANGWYKVAGNATDSNTGGPLALHATGTGCDPTDCVFRVVDSALAIYGANIVNIAGAAVSTSTAQLGVNTVQAGATAWGSGAITAAAIASAALTEAKFDTTAGTFWPFGIVDLGTAQSATGTTLVMRSAAAFADHELKGHTVVIRSATTGAGQSAIIVDNVGSTDTLTVDTWPTTPTGTITYYIVASPQASATLVPAVNATQLAGQTITAAAGVTFPTSVASPTNITAGTITTTTNLTNAPTAGDLTATMKTSVATAALTTAMTESYSTDGGTTTLAQALYLIQARLGDFSISGTTLTVKKVDGSTTAATYTLNDGTSPTSITRAS